MTKGVPGAEHVIIMPGNKCYCTKHRLYLVGERVIFDEDEYEVCGLCLEDFPQGKLGHVEVMSPKADKKCPYCPMAFVDLKARNIHMDTCDGDRKVPLKHVTAAEMCMMARCINSHSQKCDLCDQKFCDDCMQNAKCCKACFNDHFYS